MTTPPFLVVEGLEKRFGEHRVLSGVSLAVPRGEVLALLGPSGSGKTTLLRLLAGFETPDAGRVVIDGDDVTRLLPERRNVGMVFQHYALFPHLTVGANVAFGLESRGVPRAEAAGRVAEALALVDLPGFERRRPGEISGGQQQRVAVARALAPEPRLLLLDEPLSNLDPTLRERTRRELRRAILRVGITTVLVTHEQEEAFHLGDRVAVLSAGRLEQVGTPEDLYERPATRFVAGFVGRASALAGTVEQDGGGTRVRLAPGVAWAGVPAGELASGAPAELVARPESLGFSPSGATGSLVGRVVERRYAGPVSYFTVELDGTSEVEVLAASGAAGVGDAVAVVPAAGGPVPRIFPLPRAGA